MRIRTIKPEFFKHDGLSSLQPLTRLLFVGLWCMADRRGRLEDRPARIRAEVLPYDAKADVDAMLGQLFGAGYIVRYSVAGLALIQVSKFEDHQRITGKEAETESRFPGPTPGSILETTEQQPGSILETTEQQPGSIRETTETTGREGKGKEWNGVSSSAEPMEHAIYSAYPRKVGRSAALKAIARVLNSGAITPSALLAKVEEYAAATSKWPEADRAYIPHPTTWLNRGSYDDDPATWNRQQPSLPLSAARVQGAVKLSDYSPRPSLGALQIELGKVRDEIADILHPGGCTYAVEPKGEKLERYTAATARRDNIQSQINALTSPT